MTLDEFWTGVNGTALGDPTPSGLMLDAADPTALPGSVLDTGGGSGGTDWGAMAAGGLSKLLDVFATTQVAKTVASTGIAPGYTRIPGTNQVVPIGTYQAQTQTSSTTMLLIIALIIGGVLLATRKG